VPETMTRKDFKETLASEYQQLMETNFSSHDDPGLYQVRGVLLFGAAECLRSKMAIDYLKQDDMTRFGELMKVSHDGDRVSRIGSDGEYVAWQSDGSEAALHKLISDLASEDPHRVLRAQLYMQPGSYACSTKEIDKMVDIACSVPGVAGAQIAGAGLGGCIMILVQKDAVKAVRQALAKGYYRPRRLTPAIVNCIMVEGARLAEF
jgi:N-acetylgalactosamine kinase